MVIYHLFLPHLLILFIFSFFSSSSQHLEHLIANVSTSWTAHHPSNAVGIPCKHPVSFIYSPKCLGDPCIGFGFHCNHNCTFYLLSLFVYNPASEMGFPQVVWSANRNHLVSENSTLEFTQDGNLILRDVDETLVWSTNTSGKSVVGLKLIEMGNLVLFDSDNRSIWQSYDHPTDTLILGQKLKTGQKLIASVSATDWTEGLYSFLVSSDGLFAFFESDPPLSYYEYIIGPEFYVAFLNGSLTVHNTKLPNPDIISAVPLAMYIQYMKLGSDGHLRVYDWLGRWIEVADIFKLYVGECGYPLVCGRYGICENGKCSCPQSNENDKREFIPINEEIHNLGCTPMIPLSCDSPEHHRLIYLKATTHFHPTITFNDTDIAFCKQACLMNCSCQAAFFSNNTSSSCFLQSDVSSFIKDTVMQEYLYGFVKVQVAPNSPSPSFNNSPTTHSQFKTSLVVITLVIAAVILVTISYVLIQRKVSFNRDENDLGFLLGILTRFSYGELKVATTNFSRKLGEGGFGTVYEGRLMNGTRVAVKCVHEHNHMNISFQSELEAIGSIHHVNLVRLKGFCVEKSHNLLVYEYMCNGSLDKWIFQKNNKVRLDWRTRQKIVRGIARGLAYLHDECGQKILHLDVNPRNILLDDQFNAKVSDFGLSKLIDRDQSKVMTAIRGTPGYLAPEWLGYVISEKVDVYSFGIVVLEILCGRKNVDFTQKEEYRYLLHLLEKKVENNELYDLIDTHSADMQLHREEAVEMMKLAVWCVQSDFSKRPTMSMVVKVLDGLMDIELNLSYRFLYAFTSSSKPDCSQVDLGVSSKLLPSVLSGPR